MNGPRANFNGHSSVIVDSVEETNEEDKRVTLSFETLCKAREALIATGCQEYIKVPRETVDGLLGGSVIPSYAQYDYDKGEYKEDTTPLTTPLEAFRDSVLIIAVLVGIFMLPFVYMILDNN